MSELICEKGDKKVGREVMEIVHECIKDKQDRGLYEKWDRYEALGENIHYEEDEETSGIPLTSCNLLHKMRRDKIKTLFANNPTFNANAVGRTTPESKEKLKLMERSNVHWWREQNLQTVFRKKIGPRGVTLGTYSGKVLYDKEAESGVGECMVYDLDPRHLLVYPPDAQNIQECEAVLQLKPMTVRAAKRENPDHADDIKPDSEILNEVSREETIKTDVVYDYTQELGDNVWNGVGMAGEDDLLDTEKTLIVEAWVKDYSGEYPGNIRMIEVCSAGSVVLNDVPNPNVNPMMEDELSRMLYLYDKFPFFAEQSIANPNSVWGGTDFDHLAQLNEDMDKLLTFFNIIAEESVKLKLKNPSDSGVEDDDLDAGGPVVVKPHTASSGAGIGYVDPPQVPQVFPAGISLFRELFFLVAPAADISQAQTVGQDIISGKGLAMIQEMQNADHTDEQLSVEACMVEVGRMRCSLIQAFQVKEKLFTYVDDGEEKEAAISAQMLQMPIKISVVPGSTLPVSKMYKRAETQELYEKKMIDLEESLERLEVDNRKTILARMKAGPRGEFMAKLKAILPVPAETLQAIEKIMAMDTKEFEAAVKKGEIGQIQLPREGADDAKQTQQKLTQDKLATENAKILKEMEKVTAEIQKIRAETAKVQAETAKVSTDTEIGVEGAKRDKEKLEIERAKAVSDIKTKTTGESFTDNTPAGYNERGMTSNNRV